MDSTTKLGVHFYQCYVQYLPWCYPDCMTIARDTLVSFHFLSTRWHKKYDLKGLTESTQNKDPKYCHPEMITEGSLSPSMGSMCLSRKAIDCIVIT